MKKVLKSIILIPVMPLIGIALFSKKIIGESNCSDNAYKMLAWRNK